MELHWSPTSRRGVAGLAAWASLLVLACGVPPAWTKDSLPPADDGPLECSASEPRQAGHCAPRCGEYRIEFAELEGECGPRPTQTTRLARDPVKPPAPCKGSLKSSENNCSSFFDIRCPVKDESGGTLGSIERGELVWTPDGTSASGTLELQLFRADGQSRCHGRYQTKVLRL